MNRLRLFYVFSILLFLLLILFSYVAGSAGISFKDAIKVLLHQIPVIGKNFDISDISNSHLTILLKLRLPRVLTAAMTGMCLASVGAVFQSLFQNQLADPYILGISSGASLGASIAIVLGINSFRFIFSSVSLFAMAGALLTVLLVLVIFFSSPKQKATLLLAGIAAGYFASSLSSILAALNTDKIRTMAVWGMGSFAGSSWEKVTAISPVVAVGLIVILFYARDLNAISTGEEAARSFGISVTKVKVLLIITGSVLTGVTVAASGVIGFVGLVVPNGIRLVTGANYKKLIPISSIYGGIFLIICDTLARTLFFPSEIPAGAITALIGTPVFIVLILRGRK